MYDRRGKKSMEIFLRDPVGWVPKGVPPDKSIGAWLSVQEKTTGIENVGKSPCGGTNDEHQSLKVQGNLREHSVVANQEDIPTGERAGQKRTGIVTGMSMKAVTHTESPWEEYVRRVNDARPKEEDIPHGVLVNGVVITLPRPRCKRETLSPQVIKPIHAPTNTGADIIFSKEELMQKRPDWLMEKATSTELAALSQKMMDTLRQDHEESNRLLRLEMSLMQTKINSVEQKQERDVKEMIDRIQEVKQGNVMAQEKLDALFGGHVALRSEATKQHEEAKAAVLGLRSEAKKQHEEAKAASCLRSYTDVDHADEGKPG
jgi:hypothetical protein